ncbi:hypothetical protein HPB50_003761 [Hyalomma asiaticum]|uniref:Uncharacterized protein n=1 Tax=Hyalomma asiaticum TaxID=266040 RepID=A0ACB7SV83_HYAAI|nr:hypothetical protein HPB50_003761 [Hyalomma asiaticum]
MRGAGVDAVRRKEAACGRHTSMTVHHARPAVRDRVSSVSSSLAAKRREIKESDFGSGGERTCGARYPSWRVWTWPVREGQQFFLPVKLFGGGQLSRVSGGRYGQTFSEDAMPAKRGMVRALCAGAKEEEAAARAHTHRRKRKKERRRRRRRKHTDLGMRGAGVDAVRRKEAACGRHTSMTVHHARPAVRDRVSSVSSSLAAKRREIKESDFGSGGERTCGARYPSWVDDASGQVTWTAAKKNLVYLT